MKVPRKKCLDSDMFKSNNPLSQILGREPQIDFCQDIP